MHTLIAGCHYLGRVLQMPPDRQFIERSREALPEGAILILDPAMACLMKGNIDEAIREVAADHFRLFSGPDPLAPPWESVWVEKDRLLFGECTARVAELYRDWDLEICGEGRFPHDHLGLELAFMAYLLESMGQRSLSGVLALEAASRLLSEHILTFSDMVLTEALKYAGTEYYRSVCKATGTIIGRLTHILPNVKS